MSNGVVVQYVGFEPKALVREYTFSVRGSGEEREFHLNIPNEAFISHRARYQDAPGICAVRKWKITGWPVCQKRDAKAPRVRKQLAIWKFWLVRRGQRCSAECSRVFKNRQGG
jgi:hypothetical protein